MSTAIASATSPAAGNTRWFRLIPVAMIVYIISFMDRTNIAYAFAGIGHDFNLNKAQQGTAGGIFFLGYMLLQIPGGWLAEHWSAKKFVAIMICLWGLMSLACGLVRNFEQLLAARFFLGVAEGGIWPATLVLLMHWFPVQERARCYGFWISNLAISSIITQPLSGFIIDHSDWRTLFLIEGALPFIIALPLWLIFIEDYPSQAPWCGKAERDYISQSIAQDRIGEAAPGPFSGIFRSTAVWRLVGVYFLIQIGFYGLNMWMPSLLKTITNAGFGTVGLIAMLPYVTATAFLWCNGWMADRNRRYAFHVFLSVTLAAVSLMISVEIGESFLGLSILFLCLAMGGALAYDGPFWAAASRTLPVPLVAGAMGLINALGNLGGYLGPFLGGYLQDLTHNFFFTAILFSASLFLAGVLMLSVDIRSITLPRLPE